MIEPAGSTGAETVRASRAVRLDASQPVPSNYKWVALFVSTLGMLMATIDGSITLIALPDIFRASESIRWCRAIASTCCG